MHLVTESEALRCLVSVRWLLLESYALARQEGLVEPIGLVVEAAHPFAAQVAERLLLSRGPASAGQRSVTCMERAVLAAVLASAAPEVGNSLRAHNDEPGRFCVVVLSETGWVLTGSWQELFTLEASPAKRQPSRRQR